MIPLLITTKSLKSRTHWQSSIAHVHMLFLIWSCLFSCCLASDRSAACIDSGIAPERGHALLQAGQIKKHAKLGRGAEDNDELNETEVLLRVSMSSKGIGATAPLTEAGYQEVAATCCNSEMAAFTLRLVEELYLVVCDPGGLSGLVIWYNCGNTSSLDALKNNLHASQPPEVCAFVAPAGACPPKDPGCVGVFNPEAFKECTPKSPPTTEAPIKRASCPQSHPYAYRPYNGFDFCCASCFDLNDNNVNCGPYAARARHCKDHDVIQCAQPPCVDYMGLM
mmetsp:Transcript_144066/g.251056  ORF Transcript_144066/g.251056 Transcript_144066/m.251056 type:complete len:280 (+) Transcript_144066:53-892(+)